MPVRQLSHEGAKLALDLLGGQELEAVWRVATEAVACVKPNSEVTDSREIGTYVDGQEGLHRLDVLFHINLRFEP